MNVKVSAAPTQVKPASVPDGKFRLNLKNLFKPSDGFRGYRDADGVKQGFYLEEKDQKGQNLEYMITVDERVGRSILLPRNLKCAKNKELTLYDFVCKAPFIDSDEHAATKPVRFMIYDPVQIFDKALDHKEKKAEAFAAFAALDESRMRQVALLLGKNVLTSVKQRRDMLLDVAESDPAKFLAAVQKLKDPDTKLRTAALQYIQTKVLDEKANGVFWGTKKVANDLDDLIMVLGKDKDLHDAIKVPYTEVIKSNQGKNLNSNGN